MARICGYTRGGEPWTPRFVQSIDVEKCIGCGRCFKICGRKVLMPIEKPFEGEDEYGDDMGNKVMSVANAQDLPEKKSQSPYLLTYQTFTA